MNKNIAKLKNQFSVQLPNWFDPESNDFHLASDDIKGAMQLAIDLSRANVTHKTGGPFGALVVNLSTGQIISAAVNCVEAQSCSAAHAEIVALSLAQASMKTWNLSDTEFSPLTLITSCEPCAMCLGAIPWSGVSQVICGANKDDAQAAGFDEGARPSTWIEDLNARGIDVTTGVLREKAAAVLMEYAQSGQTIYNP